jgi:hypothetical protein
VPAALSADSCQEECHRGTEGTERRDERSSVSVSVISVPLWQTKQEGV